jgi:hypothetical protein
MQTEELTCARCGTPISENDCFWEEDGRICQPCMNKHEAGQRYLQKLRGTALGSLAMAILSWFFNPFFIFTVLSISGAIWTFRYFKTSDPVEQEFAARSKGFMAPPIIAICIAGLNIIVFVVRIALGLAAFSLY